MKRVTRESSFFVFLLALALFSGCGDDGAGRPALAPVSGIVKYKGEPVEGATVNFFAAGAPRAATGRTDPQGRYQLRTYEPNDGAVVGEHSVTIVKVSAAEAMSADDYAKKMQSQTKTVAAPTSPMQSQIPAKYSDPTKSGLKRTVVAGEDNSFNFDLTD